VNFKWPKSIPEDQIDKPFIQGMMDRMGFGYHNYGHMRRKYDRPDNLKNVKIRIDRYRKTGNTEWLIDAANFLMMEFAVPSHHKAHFRATESSESPGSAVAGRIIRNKSELKPATGIHAPRRKYEGD
jgi:hypothetical protein